MASKETAGLISEALQQLQQWHHNKDSALKQSLQTNLTLLEEALPEHSGMIRTMIEVIDGEDAVDEELFGELESYLSKLQPQDEEDDELFTPEILEKFCQECLDLINEMEGILLRLGAGERDPGLLSELYRGMHTFKGNCGFMGFDDMQNAAHAIESLLSDCKEKEIFPGDNIIQTVLSAIDTFANAVKSISSGGSSALENPDALLNTFKELNSEDLSDESRLHEAEKFAELAPKLTETFHEESTDLIESAIEALTGGKPNIAEALRALHCLKGGSASLQLEELAKIFHVLESRLTDGADTNLALEISQCLEQCQTLINSLAEPDTYRQKLKELSVSVESISTAQDSANAQDLSHPTSDIRQSLRIDLDKLDQLVNLVGEIIIAESLVTKHPEIEGLNLKNFERSSHQLHRLVQDLHHLAMTLRMTRVSTVFRRMNRLVLDLAKKSGKTVTLILSGEDTEIDKGICEIITDPLIHMIRNSVDHGLESSEERLRAGKSQNGTIKLSALQKPNEILLVIEDDGRGLEKEAIMNKARSKGIISEDALLSDRETWELIFAPGFSTSETVTDISGRGVGMDVVRKKIDSINGRIDISSRSGEGTRFEIHLPLSLAIIEGMLVQVGDTKYTIPITAIRQSFRPSSSEITVRPDGQEFITVRKNVLPVFRLHKLHNIANSLQDPEDAIFIIIEMNNRQICLMVDTILHQVQTVIKSLGSYMGFIRGISGCNILGNGEVALILDPEIFRELMPLEKTAG